MHISTETAKIVTSGFTAKTFSSSGDLLWSFVESCLGPTSRAGTLLVDVGPNIETKASHSEQQTSSIKETNFPYCFDDCC
jgi:hypothetical protein